MNAMPVTMTAAPADEFTARPDDSAPAGLQAALREVSATSAGGAPFLFAFGVTLALCALLPLWLPLKTAALILLFQGNLALPAALLLERRMGSGRMSRSNPLRPLSVQLALSQALALPAAFIAYSFHPAMVPAALAAIAGAHFLPYAWLQRTRVYAVLGVAVSLGTFALTVALKRDAFVWALVYMSATYLISGLIVRARALRHVRGATA